MEKVRVVHISDINENNPEPARPRRVFQGKELRTFAFKYTEYFIMGLGCILLAAYALSILPLIWGHFAPYIDDAYLTGLLAVTVWALCTRAFPYEKVVYSFEDSEPEAPDESQTAPRNPGTRKTAGSQGPRGGIFSDGSQRVFWEAN